MSAGASTMDRIQTSPDAEITAIATGFGDKGREWAEFATGELQAVVGDLTFLHGVPEELVVRAATLAVRRARASSAEARTSTNAGTGRHSASSDRPAPRSTKLLSAGFKAEGAARERGAEATEKVLSRKARRAEERAAAARETAQVKSGRVTAARTRRDNIKWRLENPTAEPARKGKKVTERDLTKANNKLIGARIKATAAARRATRLDAKASRLRGFYEQDKFAVLYTKEAFVAELAVRSVLARIDSAERGIRAVPEALLSQREQARARQRIIKLHAELVAADGGLIPAIIARIEVAKRESEVMLVDDQTYSERQRRVTIFSHRVEFGKVALRPNRQARRRAELTPKLTAQIIDKDAGARPKRSIHD